MGRGTSGSQNSVSELVGLPQMGKFEKAVQANSLETLRFVSSGKVVSLETDPLKFTVETADRVFVELDLTRYRDGNNSLGLTGCPSLIMDLLPIIKRNVGQKQRTRKAIRELLLPA